MALPLNKLYSWYNSERTSFYERYLHFDSIEQLRKAVQNKPSASVRVERTIDFGEVRLGDSVKEVKRVLGHPSYERTSPSGDLVSLLYRTKVNGIKFNKVLYFSEDEFIYGQFILSPKSINEKQNLLDTLKEKYQLLFIPKQSVMSLSDGMTNLWVNDFGYFTINYVSKRIEVFNSQRQGNNLLRIV